MVSAQAQLHGNIGDDEIEYRFKIDTGHVENTTSPNRVSYSFKIPPGLLEKGYVYIIDNFDFAESYRVGNCSLNHKINNDSLEVEAVARAVKHSSGLWYTKGGWLKGIVIVTLKKMKYIGVEHQPESIISIIDSFNQNKNKGDSIVANGNDNSVNFGSGNIVKAGRDINGNINLGQIIGDVSNSIGQLPDTKTSDEPSLKELLIQLKTAIETEDELKDQDKAEALEQVQVLADAGKKPQDGVIQKSAKTAIYALKGIISGLSTTTKLVQECNNLIPAITTLLSL